MFQLCHSSIGNHRYRVIVVFILIVSIASIISFPYLFRKGPLLLILYIPIWVLIIMVVGIVLFSRRKKRLAVKAEAEAEAEKKVEEEEELDQVLGIPIRFTYDELQSVTENFSKKIGEGGTGSVFEGTLTDGTRVAVKWLEGLGHVKKSFLAEVQTIGKIHHVNLVRLLGFCAEKSNLLLVYEFMSKGSLDRWIFPKTGYREVVLNWPQRKRIIHQIAKGLNYLHEDCWQKIIHPDVKPQNVLLDNNFVAKVSDFGLSKLVEKDKSQTTTTIRGTPGYMAPEWLYRVITEKVDVYSFGMVVLETVCGRKMFDVSQVEEDDKFLLDILKRKAKEGRLLDMAKDYGVDMELYGSEVENMIKLAAWCLQVDRTKRPTMSMVIQVIDEGVKVENDLDYNFWYRHRPAKRRDGIVDAPSAPLLSWILSGPR